MYGGVRGRELITPPYSIVDVQSFFARLISFKAKSRKPRYSCSKRDFGFGLEIMVIRSDRDRWKPWCALAIECSEGTQSRKIRGVVTMQGSERAKSRQGL